MPVLIATPLALATAPPYLSRRCSRKAPSKPPAKPRITHQNFPAELQDMIIDHLHDDKETLASCSLVCKSWLPASRFHLFRKIRLELPRESAEGLAADFARFLRRNPHICFLVRELHLVGDILPIPVTYLKEDAICSILAPLTKLRELTIHSFQLATGNLSSGGRDEHVQSRDVFDAISGLHDLRGLRLLDFSCDDWDDTDWDEYQNEAPGHTRTSMSQLHTLQLQNVCIPRNRLQSLFEMVVAEGQESFGHDDPKVTRLHQVSLSLEHGRISQNSVYNVDICGSLFRQVGASVEHLVLDLWGMQGDAVVGQFQDDTSLWKNLSLVSCRNLKCLELWIPAHLGHEREDQVWLAAISLLSGAARMNCPLRSLRIVAIDPVEVQAPSRRQLPQVFAQFDDAVCKLPHLQSVAFNKPDKPIGCRWSSCGGEFLSVLPSLLPMASARGLLVTPSV